ncbi:MAG TPA: LacI family DNA-binding transcriptional regulator [Tepidisphaeraceae bacterium]|jgi:DNA-binding LacI/PurR family transcriptional regulator
MSPTLVDIARETHTSVSTVSRVLSGGAMANRISKETRQRVQEAAQRLGYRPNLLARSLRTRRTYTVALIVSDIANPFFAQLGSLIERSLARHGYSLMLCNSAEDVEKEADYLRLVAAKGIDGLIVVPLARTRKQILQAVPEKMPLVVLDRPIEGIPSVASDQDQMSHILSDALDQAGVKKIALLCGPQHIITHRRRCEVLASRFEVLARHEGPAQKATGREAFDQKFAPVIDKVQAVVCTNNFLAQGVVDLMSDIDNPPVVGVFDEITMFDLLRIPIVCSMQDIPALAEGCVTQILKLLERTSEPVQPILLDARVVTNRAFQRLLAKSNNAASVAK